MPATPAPTAYQILQVRLHTASRAWLITCVAGFIGSVLRSLENPITTKRIDEGLALAMPWYIGQK